MAKSKERLEAQALRKKGKSIKEIARLLRVSNASVSTWTRDIPLTPKQQQRLLQRKIDAGHKGRILGAEANKQKRITAIRAGEKEACIRFKNISRKDLFAVGLGLYWGEGVKANRSEVSIINSDPRVIKLMMRWFEECWGITKDRFHPRIFISDTHRDREEVVIKYWMKTLGLPRSQFRKIIFLAKRKKIYENREVYYGVLALRISKGADIKYRIIAHIDRIANLAMPA